MRVFRANVPPRPTAGEGDCFLIHALCLSVKVSGEFRRLRKTLASTLALPPDLRKIIKKILQGATPRHRTLPSPNFARCYTDASHPAPLSCCTLQHRAIAPCHFHPPHSAMQKGCFLPLKSPITPSALPHLPASWAQRGRSINTSDCSRRLSPALRITSPPHRSLTEPRQSASFPATPIYHRSYNFMMPRI